MAHTILPSSQPNIAHLRLSGDLTHADMHCDEALGLNAGKPIAILLDATGMSLTLPERFLDGARTSLLVNPNTLHLAIVIKSPLLTSVALMVAKFTQRRDKLSVHDTLAAAEAHLLAVLRKHQL